MSSQLIDTINRHLHASQWPSDITTSPATKEQYERGLDAVHAYRGDSEQLFDALRQFQAIPSRPYAFAGVAYTLLAASYLYDTEYQAEGIEEAGRWLVEAQSSAPNLPEINFIIVIYYALQEKYKSAQAWLDSLITDPPNYYACIAEMRYWEKQDDIHKVYDAYLKATQSAERSEQRLYAIHLIAGSLLEANLPIQASEMYEHLAQHVTDDPWLWHNLSVAYYQMGEYKKAHEANQSALALRDFDVARNMTQRLEDLLPKKQENEPTYTRYEMLKTFYEGITIAHICRDRYRDSAVVLKTLRPDLLNNPQGLRQKFVAQGEAWIKLQTHPHIVPAYRMYEDEEEQKPFIVHKWLEPALGKTGASLRAWLEPNSPLRLQQALSFGLHIVRGMKHATTVMPTLVHHDLRPENVLISYDKQARVSNFGLAGIAANQDLNNQEQIVATTPFESSNNSVGSPIYMAPEQWRGERVDQRTDIYAFGCILYEMMTGHPVAQGETLTDIAFVHTSGDLRPLPADTPEPLKRVISRACAIGADNRYATWQEVESALSTVYQHLLKQPAPPLPVEDMRALNQLDLGWTFNALGKQYSKLSKHKQAYSYYEQAYQMGQAERRRHLLQPESEPAQRAKELENYSLTHMGLSYLDRQMLDEAEDTLERSVRLAEENKNRIEEARAVGNLGIVYLQQNKLQRAQVHLMRDLALSYKVGEKENLPITLANLGTAEMRLGRLPKAKQRFEKALVAAQQRGDQETLITVLGHLATIHRKLGELDRSAELSHQQQELATKLGDRRAESQAVGNLANVTRDQGDLKQAIKLYQRKITLSSQFNEGLAVARANVNLSQIYMQQKNWAKAIPYAESALQEFEKAGHTEGIEDISLALVSNRQKVGHYAVSQKQYMQARRQFERALDTLQPLGYQELQLELLNHVSEVCRLQKDKKRTSSYAQDAIALAQNINHRPGELQALLTLARLEQDEGKRANARQQYQEILTDAQAEREWLILSEANLALAQLSLQDEKWDDAEQYASTALEMRSRVSGQQGADEIREQVTNIQAQAKKGKGGFFSWLNDLLS